MNYETNLLKQQIVILKQDLDRGHSKFIETSLEVKLLQSELLARELDYAKMKARPAYSDKIRESELIVCKAEISKMKIKNSKMIEVYERALELDMKLKTKFVCEQIVYFFFVILSVTVIYVQYVN